MGIRYTLLAFALLCIVVNTAAQRTTDQLKALYTFREGGGQWVSDVSSNGSSMLLQIQDTNAVSWLNGGGISITSPTLIRSLGSAFPINQAAEQNNALTIEAWISPANTTQNGPSVIAGIGYNASNRNAALRQTGNRYASRIRTSTTDNNGTSDFQSPSGSLNTVLQHVVFTHAADGTERLFVNGVLLSSNNRPGNLNNWNSNFELVLANELTGGRPWLGKIYLVAFYAKALSSIEISANYASGAIQNGFGFSSQSCSSKSCYIDGYGTTQRGMWLPNLTQPVGTDYQFENGGAFFEVFDDGTAHLYGNEWNLQNPSFGWYCDIWFSGKMNWIQWSSLGRSWKGSASIVGNLYQTWDYYIVDTTRASTITGLGGFAGSLINITNKPANYYYGLQVGVAANDKNNLPGASFWWYGNGTINSQPYSGSGDYNLEGLCVTLPVLSCPTDVSVDCESYSSPLTTGTAAVLCADSSAASFTDILISQNCPLMYERTWTAISAGQQANCTQTITVIDSIAPVLNMTVPAVLDCLPNLNTLFTATDGCGNVNITTTLTDSLWMTSEPCATGNYRTQTQGGWGANPNGNNPGVYLHTHFASAFPEGLVIGCGTNTLRFTTAQAITDFLPSGGTPSALLATMVNPQNYGNTLAGQLVAATLNMGFDLADADFSSSSGHLGGLTYVSGPFAGKSVAEVIQLANAFIGGCSNVYSASQLNAALTAFNENFDNGNVNQGSLDCEGPAPCYLQLTVHASATDACNNSVSSDVVVYIVDTVAPVFASAPIELRVSCGAVPDPILEATDGCFGNNNVVVTHQDILFSGSCLPTIQRTYSASDFCGNAATWIQYIHVADTIAPVFTLIPQDTTVECVSQVPDFTPQAEDECSAAIITLHTDTLGSACNRTIIRTWTASDACGNASTIVQHITTHDQTPPAPISAWSSTHNFVCGNGVWEDVTFEDNCSSVTLYIADDTTGTGCNLVITRTITATDACGNDTSIVMTAYTGDDVPPVFSFIPADTTLACSSNVSLINAVATDNCHLSGVQFSEMDSTANGYCRILLRKWIATDDCGNITVARQTIRFIDQTPPVGTSIPRSLTTDCATNIPLPQVVFTDNCDPNVEVSFTEIPGGTPCQQTFLRTWIGTDDCGNQTIVRQMVTKSDLDAPVITGLSNITRPCHDFQGIYVTATDNCSSVPSIIFTDVVNSLGCNGSITRTYRCTDACGNQSMFIQQINLQDTTAPVINPLTNLVISCQDNLTNIQATATDNCDIAPILSYQDTQTGSGCNIQITRVWTATDACGNSSSATQTIQIIDNIPPVLQGVPSNQSYDCSQYVYTIPAAVTASDNCSNATVTFAEQNLPGPCANAFILVRTWTATDACGNVAAAQQRITVNDNTAPIFDQLPQDINTSCNNIPAAPQLTAHDPCGGVVVITLNIQNLTGGCPVIKRTWTATDACGNSTMAIQNVHIIDNEPPLIQGVPPGGPISCNNIPPVAQPQVSDNCDSQVTVTVNENMVGNGCQYTLIRTYVAQDDCGNSAVVSQSFTVTDNTPPVFVNPQPNVTVSCNQLAGYNGPNAVDGCASVVTRTFSDIAQGSGCSYTIIRTYRASDLCGNVATFTQNILVIDNAGPVISGVPLSTFVSCSNIPPVPNVTANDACSGVVPVTYAQTQIGTGCNYQLQRRWTATDPCGNTSVKTQLIYVSDNATPIFSNVPQSVIIACGQPVPAAVAPIVTDNCTSNPAVVFTEQTTSVNCTTTILRRWTATDGCGNSSFVTQTIQILDQTGPVINNVPANATFSCSALPAPPVLTAVDACSGAASVTYSEETIPGACPYTLFRKWRAVDACGNATVAQQTILIQDDIAPVLQNTPVDTVVGCEVSNLPVAPVTAIDGCSGNLTPVFAENRVDGACIDTIYRRWTATDYCSNTVTHVQRIIVRDQSAPVFTTNLLDLSVQCGSQAGSPAQVNAIDCNAFDIVFEEVSSNTNCADNNGIIRIWTATDACGNASTLTQNIAIQDITAPVLSAMPTDITVACNEVPPLPVVTASDNCNPSIPVVFNESHIFLGHSDTTSCSLVNAVNGAGTIAIWLPGINGVSTDYSFGNVPGTMTTMADGTVHITGLVYNNQNNAQGWSLDLWLATPRNWNQWHALGRSYKDDTGLVGNNYLDWTYYELLPSSKLYGTGAFSGSVLSLSHQPSNYYYGFQLGMAANNRNANYGMSGWFFYQGSINGAAVSGHGDLLIENLCCPNEDIIRTWSARDCKGNITTHTQTIHVLSSAPQLQAMAINNNNGEMDVTGSMADFFTVQYKMKQAGNVNMGLFDGQGQLLKLFNWGNAEAGITYRMLIPKDGLSPGIYFFRLQQGVINLSDQELVMK